MNLFHDGKYIECDEPLRRAYVIGLYNPEIENNEVNDIDSLRKKAREILEDRLSYALGSKVRINKGEYKDKEGVITNKSSRGYIVEIDKKKSIYTTVPEEDLTLI